MCLLVGSPSIDHNFGLFDSRRPVGVLSRWSNEGVSDLWVCFENVIEHIKIIGDQQIMVCPVVSL